MKRSCPWLVLGLVLVLGLAACRVGDTARAAGPIAVAPQVQTSSDPVPGARHPLHTTPPAASPTPAPATPADSNPAAQAPTPKKLTFDDCVVIDAITKVTNVPHGTREASFTFNLTNVSKEVVVILSAVGSCGCTGARLPAEPWRMEPGTNGQMVVTMDVAGKVGTVPKTVLITSDRGTKTVNVVTVIAPAGPAELATMDRNRNQQLASTDRQAVFKNSDCARCHVEPTRDKMGQELFASACGICHEAPNRASMVPDLHVIASAANADLWRNWIIYGKPGSLMPAFSQAEGGILTDAQIQSLVNYLTSAFPAKAASTAPPSAAPAVR